MSYPTYTIATAITPADAGIHIHKALFVGTGGNVSVNLRGGGTGASNTILFPNVPTGTILPIHTYKVNATGTTALGIVGLD